MPPRRILVIDDDPYVCEIVKLCLKPHAGLAVELALDGEEGVQIARQRPPHLILLDYDLPGLDGLDTLQLLRTEPAGARIPVIAITGALHVLPRCRQMIAGCDRYLPKPFDFRRLDATLLSLLPAVDTAQPSG